VSCDRERVSALVDGALEGPERELVESHVGACDACRVQVAEEEALRASLRALPPPELPFGLEQKVRARLRRGRGASALTRGVLALAAVLVSALWIRGYAPFVAWELSRDHNHCFGMHEVPAQVWASEPTLVADWFQENGARVPLLPASVGPLSLLGGRFCALPDISHAAHVYYASDKDQVSVFAVPHDVRMQGDFSSRTRGNVVTLLHLGSHVVAVVGDDEELVVSFARRLRTSVARLEARGPS
jgi:anti-sigma factor RsiW